MQPYMTRMTAGLQLELHALRTAQPRRQRPHPAPFAVRNLAACELRAQASNPRIIEIERDRAVGADVSIKSALFARYAGQTAQSFEVSTCNQSDDAATRIGNFGKPLNFTRMIRAELHDSDLVIFTQAQESQWQPHEIVKVALGF